MKPIWNASVTKPYCPLCASSRVSLWWQGPGIDCPKNLWFRLYSCDLCSFGFVHQPPLSKDTDNLYPRTFFRSQRVDKNPRGVLSRALSIYERFTYHKRLHWLGQPGRRGKLLDVGCGNGKFLDLARKAGWNTEGVDKFSPGVTSDHDTYDQKIHHGTILDIELPKHSYDAVTFWHSLEHMPDFMRVLHHAKTLLKPGGRLIIAVPNFESADAKLFRDSWALFDVPRHIQFFTPSNLRKIIEILDCKLERESYFSMEFNFPVAIQNVLNLICTRKMFLYNATKREMKTSESLSPIAYGLNLVLSVVGLTVVAIPSAIFSIVSSILRRGTTYTVCAVNSSLDPGKTREKKSA